MARIRYAFPKFKVFIFGQEITKDVTSVSTSQHDGDAPNICQITILNEKDKYVMTTEDMAFLSKVDVSTLNIPWLKPSQAGSSNPGTVEESGLPLKPGDSKFSDRLNSGNFAPEKRAILLRKNSEAFKENLSPSERNTPAGLPATSTTFANYFNHPVKRYPLVDGSAVFGAMDPVRVFMRDPYDPTRWYHHFCGFVSDVVDNTDENNVKTLTIQVEDPTKLFRYSRIFINPGIVDAKPLIQDEDLKVRSFQANFLKGLSLTEIFFSLMFGPDKTGTQSLQDTTTPDHGTTKMAGVNGEAVVTTKMRGIGHFSFDGSGVFTFGPPQDAEFTTTTTVGHASETTEHRQPDAAAWAKRPATKPKLVDTKTPINIANDLPVWQATIDHEVQPSDLWTMLEDSLRSTQGDSIVGQVNSTLASNGSGSLDVEAVVDYIGQHPEYYLVDGGRLLMLIPNSLGADNTNVIVNDITQSSFINSEWQSAGKIMWETVNRIQFSIYCTPKGDIVVEPPLFDFDPHDFGMSPIRPSTTSTGSTPKSALDVVAEGNAKFKSNVRGPFGPNYVLTRSDVTSWESAQVDSQVHTIGVGSRHIFQNWESLPNMSIIGGQTVVKIADLIPIYGLRELPCPMKGYVATAEGANYFIQTMLNRTNADAHTLHVQHMPRLQLGINRPIYLQGRNCIATTKNVSHSLTWRSEMSTSCDLYSTRTWDGTMSATDPTMPVYAPLGGYASRPLNYALLMNKASKPKGETVPDTVTSSVPVLGDISPGLDERIAEARARAGKRGG